MKISWYPGHMNKARKELARVMSEVDVVIEVLDARIPRASENPLLKKLRGELPCLRILNKSDLADPETTALWCQYLQKKPLSYCLVNGLDSQVTKKDVIRACRVLAGQKKMAGKSFQALITGIPNVGKSTLLNQIQGRKVAATGNEPAITKGQQRVRLDEEWYLIDTPGMMWPKLEDQQAAYRLACVGSIRNTAVDAVDIAWFLAELLLKDFYPLLDKRYQLPLKPDSVQQFMEHMAIQHGCLGKGGRPDWNRVAELLLNDFRSGRLGRISLEAPGT